MQSMNTRALGLGPSFRRAAHQADGSIGSLSARAEHSADRA
jgi:hypothetical protein